MQIGFDSGVSPTMSYDYMLFRPRVSIASYKEISEHILETLGNTEAVMSRLNSEFPSVEWDTTGGQIWGVLHIGEGRLEIVIGDVGQEDILSISLKASSRTSSVHAIQELSNALGLTSMDMQTCELIPPKTA